MHLNWNFSSCKWQKHNSNSFKQKGNLCLHNRKAQDFCLQSWLDLGAHKNWEVKRERAFLSLFSLPSFYFSLVVPFSDMSSLPRGNMASSCKNPKPDSHALSWTHCCDQQEGLLVGQSWVTCRLSPSETTSTERQAVAPKQMEELLLQEGGTAAELSESKPQSALQLELLVLRIYSRCQEHKQWKSWLEQLGLVKPIKMKAHWVMSCDGEE